MKHSKILITSIVVVIVVALSIFLYFYWKSLEFLSIFVTNALWASVLLTVILVIINISTIIQTRQTISEMEKARKSEFLTHVRVELSWYVPAFLVLKITNFGKGAAIHINAKITFLPSKIEKNWKDGVLAPIESMNIFLPYGNVDAVRSTITRIVVTGNYQDIFGQFYEITEEIPVTEFIDETFELNPVYEQNKLVTVLTESNKKIKDELRQGFTRISRSNQKLKDEIIDEIRKINYNLERIAANQETRNSEEQ